MNDDYEYEPSVGEQFSYIKQIIYIPRFSSNLVDPHKNLGLSVSRWVNLMWFKYPIEVLVHGHVMNFREEKLDISLNYLSTEPVCWYSKDQSANKTVLG